MTVNTANPLPSPTDTNRGASQDDLPSSNLELGKGCYGRVNILASYSYTSVRHAAKLTVPSPWVNGGDCSYGGVGSNSAGGNTDTTNATCPPSQADVNEGYVSCSITASSGNDENGQANYSTMDLFFNGQPVPQQSTATLSTGGAEPGGTGQRDRWDQLVGDLRRGAQHRPLRRQPVRGHVPGQRARACSSAPRAAPPSR